MITISFHLNEKYYIAHIAAWLMICTYMAIKMSIYTEIIYLKANYKQNWTTVELYESIIQNVEYVKISDTSIRNV